MEKECSSHSGVGMSRAAKKRAKKKKKQSTLNPTFDANRSAPDNGGDDSMTEDEVKNPIIKKQKRSKEIVSASSYSDKKDYESKNYPLFPYPSDLSLFEILLLDGRKNKETSEKLHSMTAIQRASFLLQAILSPISIEEFYSDYFEKKPLVIHAKTTKDKSKYNGLLSLKSIKDMTKNHQLYYGRDLNVTKYKKDSDGVKRRINLDKMVIDDDDNNNNDDVCKNKAPSRGALVENSELWSDYENGCTLRLLCPHKYNDAIQALLSTLEVEFQCMVGANAYLTPPGSSQGFAPHYDDIEAFCLQLQGSKRWKVYCPITDLPRRSSEDFTLEFLQGTKLFFDVTLSEGDLLYLPRGWIHQACTLTDKNKHSLHLTISSMQQWAWVDLMEIAIPEALNAAAMSETSTSLREGLPKGFMDYMGVMYEDLKASSIPNSLKAIIAQDDFSCEKQRLRAQLKENFRSEAKKRIMEVAKTACEMLDVSCDEMAKRFLSERQPPALTVCEAALVSQGDETADEKIILPNTLCRLVRPGVGRLVVENDKAVIYHCFDNSREYQQNPISPLEFEMDDAAALEQLMTTIEPDWIHVNDLFHDSIEDKIQLVQALYDENIIALRND